MSATLNNASVLPLLRPVLALASWTFAMEGALYWTRIRHFNTGKAKLSNETTKAQIDAQFPPRVRWKSDNFAHLHEQPTVFYAVALTLAILGKGQDGITVSLTWAYVGLRVLHSLIQCTTNHIMTRFSVFIVSSFTLLGMTGRAIQAVYA